ncbi:MAG: hypothetical protein ACLQLG_16820 [Thermoguttaceae bacterium]
MVAPGGRGGARRRGLATLEMVLALPLLLMIMAVIINYGTLACWKVRGLSMARMTVWGNRWPRSNNGNPQPTYWPAPGTTAMTGPTPLPGQVDDPRVDQEVARGPEIGNAQVNTELLDPARGLLQSSANLTRNWPMLGKWPPYHLQATTCLLDDQWQYNTPLMGMGSNQTRRIPIIYTLPQAPASLANAYIQAIEAIVNASFQQQLATLTYYPAFPNGQYCDSNRADYQQPVQNLIYQIQGRTRPHVAGVAETMADIYITMYQNQLNAGGLSDAQTTLIQTYLSQLRQFVTSLQKGG